MNSFLKRYEKVLPFFFALLFILLTASHLSRMQNPDELLHRVTKALEGRWQFDETNFDYPSLPKYVMFGVGQVVYALGFADKFDVVARFLSVLLGAGTVFLVYKITRRSGGAIFASSFAALFLISNYVFSVNARFAHNDLYLTFFITLSFYFLLRYADRQEKGWLYGVFFSVGLAASSKYNGGVFVLMPLLVWMVYEGKNFLAEKLRTFEVLFLGATLTFLGFAVGTPKSLLWMAFYFKRVLPALSRHATFGKTAASVPGIIGQGTVLTDVLGWALLPVCVMAALYFGYRFVIEKRRNAEKAFIWMVLPAILIYDFPIMTSYNYPARFFLPLLPFFAVLFGMFVEEITNWVGRGNFERYQVWVGGVALVILVLSGLRVISVRLLLANDSRIPAGEMIDMLPADSSIEYTFYTPEFAKERFEREHDYPVYFIKHEGDVMIDEIDKGYKMNRGEAGLLSRDTDYLVIDSFTYARCANEAVYATNPVECAFFAELLAGKTSYELIAEFSYSLPKFLPPISISFVNPEIQIFQKRE